MTRRACDGDGGSGGNNATRSASEKLCFTSCYLGLSAGHFAFAGEQGSAPLGVEEVAYAPCSLSASG